MIQIPITGFLNLDFSIVIIFISYFFFGYSVSLVVSIISPWLALPLMTFPDPVGVLSLMFLNILVISIFQLAKYLKINFKNKKNSYLNIALNILITPILLGLINMAIIYPLYGLPMNEVDNLILVWTTSYPFTVMKLFITLPIGYAISYSLGNIIIPINIKQRQKW